MTKKITSEELKRVWELPGCNGTRNNGAGAHCALGKLDLLVSSFPYLMRGKEIVNSEIVILNNGNLARNLARGLPYGPENHKEWDKHIRAFRLALEIAQENKLIEIEDEAAREFGLIKEGVIA